MYIYGVHKFVMLVGLLFINEKYTGTLLLLWNRKDKKNDRKQLCFCKIGLKLIILCMHVLVQWAKKMN